MVTGGNENIEFSQSCENRKKSKNNFRIPWRQKVTVTPLT